MNAENVVSPTTAGSEVERVVMHDGYEWECPACGEKGDYASLRKPVDRGVDTCPNCSTEVECLDE